MLVDGALSFRSDDVGAEARELELAGYDGAWSAETGHDPLMIVAGAATTTTTLELGTGIVVAFARSPMITATMANDVQLFSHGRLLLGLGSQIKPHIEKRYSMPWSHPAPRMREYILAMRAIWACWHEGVALNFRGEYYRHTLMSPFFNPGPNPYGAPQVYLAAVGELMTEVAGEVADGLLVHPFSTERYIREVTLPALERGQGDLANVALGGEGMDEEAVSDFTRDFGHQFAHCRQVDLRRAVRVRAGIEKRRHERVSVVLTAKVECYALMPTGPNGPHRQDVLAHSRRGVRPRHRVALLNVRFDL